MPNITPSNYLIPTTTSFPKKVGDRITNSIHKFTIRMKNKDPEKVLNTLDTLNCQLFQHEECFAVNLYKKNQDQTIQDCIDKLSQFKKIFFNVTKENPYKFNREREREFLTNQIDKASGIDSGKFSILKNVITRIDYTAAAIEKNIKKKPFFNDQTASYKLRVEVLVDEYCNRTVQSRGNKPQE